MQIGSKITLNGWHKGGSAILTERGDASLVRDRRSMYTLVPLPNSTWEVFKIETIENVERIFLIDEKTCIYFCNSGPFASYRYIETKG